MNAPMSILNTMMLACYLCDGNKPAQIKRLARKYMNRYQLQEPDLYRMLQTIEQHPNPVAVVQVSWCKLTQTDFVPVT